MKKGFILLLVLISSVFVNAQTIGELDVSVITSQAGGQYAPKNCVAIWVEDESGNYVKTLLAYAQMYRIYLNNWEASTIAAGSPFNNTDAISGATVGLHGTRNCSWDGTDYQGVAMDNGTYRVCMELTDKNSTGNYSHFTFIKSDVEETQTPSNVPSFSDISLVWTVSQNAVEEAFASKISVLPNPTSGIITVNAENIKSIEVWNIAGKHIMKSNRQTLDISAKPSGIYFIKVTTDDATITRRILKQ
jgi:hypothetical protein